MIDRLHSRYGIDRERVYLTGFSNGGMMTRRRARGIRSFSRLYHPGMHRLPRPGPALRKAGGRCRASSIWVTTTPSRGARKNRCWSRCSGQTVVRLCGRPGGFVPDAIYNGENHYTAARGYTEGERFGTAVYRDAQGVPRVCVTVMKNMPHGAIHDESRAAWEFMRRYRRPGNGKAVETVPHTESTETECAKQKEERLK